MATHSLFSIHRPEHHYTFFLAPAKYEDQVPRCLEAVTESLRSFTWQYDFHKHYYSDRLAKEWDIWTPEPIPKELLKRIRRIQGVMWCFRSPADNRLLCLSDEILDAEDDEYLDDESAEARKIDLAGNGEILQSRDPQRY